MSDPVPTKPSATPTAAGTTVDNRWSLMANFSKIKPLYSKKRDCRGMKPNKFAGIFFYVFLTSTILTFLRLLHLYPFGPDKFNEKSYIYIDKMPHVFNFLDILLQASINTFPTFLTIIFFEKFPDKKNTTIYITALLFFLSAAWIFILQNPINEAVAFSGKYIEYTDNVQIYGIRRGRRNGSPVGYVLQINPDNIEPPLPTVIMNKDAYDKLSNLGFQDADYPQNIYHGPKYCVKLLIQKSGELKRVSIKRGLEIDFQSISLCPDLYR